MRLAKIAPGLFFLFLPLLAEGQPLSGPHNDPSLLPRRCGSCHKGHSVADSPLLPQPQAQMCLSCHSSPSNVEKKRAQGELSAIARPHLLGDLEALPYQHPMGLFSSPESGLQRVTCASCHDPHQRPRPASAAAGPRKPSPTASFQFEFELCLSCHGWEGSADVFTSTNIARLVSPDNRSFHPVTAPALEPSPSVIPKLRRSFINCTDCHGDDGSGSRGLHGSRNPGLLRKPLNLQNGVPETPEAYALCYSCHERQKVLEESLFPLHKKHVVDAKIACTGCHDPHGSPKNRALITFDAGALFPSASGRREFLSLAPGRGACYLSCHGVNHDPASYGGQWMPTPPGELPGLPGATEVPTTIPPREVQDKVPSQPRSWLRLSGSKP